MSENLVPFLDRERICEEIDRINTLDPGFLTETQYQTIRLEVYNDIENILSLFFPLTVAYVLLPQYVGFSQHTFLRLSMIPVLDVLGSLSRLIKNSSIILPSYEQISQRDAFMNLEVTPLIQECVSQILYASKDQDLSDTEVTHALRDLQKFFYDNGWRDKFDDCTTRIKYIQHWLEHKTPTKNI